MAGLSKIEERRQKQLAQRMEDQKAIYQIGKVEDLDIKNIQLDRIHPNPLNEKYMKKITDRHYEMLKASILEMGLMHNLVVIDDYTGNYRLISGEKRWRALCKMTEEEFKKHFPDGVPCKVLKDAAAMSQDEEWRVLLECNVFAFSNEKPDAEQVRDLMAIYDRMGFGEQEIIDYFNEKLSYELITIQRVYSEATAIPELQELQKKGKFTTAAMRRMCQGNNKELQKKCYEIIQNEYEDVETIDEDTAGQIKKQAKKLLNGIDVSESKACTNIRTTLKKSMKGFSSIQKVKVRDLSVLEADLCVRELEEIKRQADQYIEKIKNRELKKMK